MRAKFMKAGNIAEAGDFVRGLSSEAYEIILAARAGLIYRVVILDQNAYS